ncbi:MAG: hypothetical protein HEQ39_04195 [Rhizobacter sp.]
MSLVQHLFLRARTAALWCAFVCGLAVIAGCGPGTGGTGTGQSSSALDYFGATPANVCTSGPTSALACTEPSNPGAVGAVIQPSPGNASERPLIFANGSGNINLFLEDNRATLIERCSNLKFDGNWGVTGNKDARFFGEYTTANDGTSVLATVTALATGADGKSLEVTLRDASGKATIGPVKLDRVFGPTSNPAACRP